MKECKAIDYDAVLVFKWFIFILCFPCNKIFIWDIQKNIWYTSHIRLPFIRHPQQLIYTYLHNYIVHILRYPECDHFTVDIFNLIPPQMKKYYAQINKKLVIGYCLQQEYTIPFVLQTLISSYYPSFI